MTRRASRLYGKAALLCRLGLKYVSTLDQRPLGELDIPPAGHRNGGKPPRGPLGPTRLELDKPVYCSAKGPAVAGGMNLRYGVTSE